MPTTKEETDKVFDELKKSGKLKDLNEEQRRNLEEIEKIEKEQAELLKQLSMLTTMVRINKLKIIVDLLICQLFSYIAEQLL